MSKRTRERCVTILPDDVWHLICAYFINECDIKTCLNILNVSVRATIWFGKSLQSMLNLVTFLDHGVIYEAVEKARAPEVMGFIRQITQSQRLLNRSILSEILYFLHVCCIVGNYSTTELNFEDYPFRRSNDVKIRQVFYYDTTTRRMRPLVENPDIKVVNIKRDCRVIDEAGLTDDLQLSKLSFYSNFATRPGQSKLTMDAMFYDIYRDKLKHWDATTDDLLENVVFRLKTHYHHIGVPTPQTFHQQLYMYHGVGTIEKKKMALLMHRNFPRVKHRSLALLKEATVINIG